LVLLFKTLKSGGKSSSKLAAMSNARAKPPTGVSDEQFLEMLARTQIEELLKKDPERVSSILSRWATEEEPVKAGS
jgi:hypothetical protein